MKVSYALSAFAYLALIACSPEPGTVVTEKGPVTTSQPNSSYSIFSYRYQEIVQSPDLQSSATKNFALVEAGTQLEYQLCSSFFQSAGKQQQVLLFSKDLITFVAATAAGALGAARASPAAIAWIGLGGAGIVSAENIYARNFLFSEDNVQAIEDLTLRAVAAARDASLSDSRMNFYTFPSAISAIMDVQSVCEVQNILNLARDAIKNGVITTSSSTSGIQSALALTAEISLGRITKGGTPITDTELGALYWIYRSPQPPVGDAQKKMAATALMALTPPPLIPSGATNPAFKEVDAVVSVLAGLPSGLTDQLDAAIQKSIVAPPKDLAGLGAPPGLVASQFSVQDLAPAGAESNLGRINVGIQPLN